MWRAAVYLLDSVNDVFSFVMCDEGQAYLARSVLQDTY